MDNTMSRRKRLRQCKLWRCFINDVFNAKTEDHLKAILWKLSAVKDIEILHGWTTWVTVELQNGKQFIENEFWAHDSLRIIAGNIYKYAVGEYLDYIKYYNKTQSHG